MSRCKRCGHDRMDHEFGDSCWHELHVDDAIKLCDCSGFQPLKLRIFQIGYTPEPLALQARMLKSDGYYVSSVLGNEAAMTSLRFLPQYDFFLLGDPAEERTRREMVDWLRANYARPTILLQREFDAIRNRTNTWLQ